MAVRVVFYTPYMAVRVVFYIIYVAVISLIWQ